MKNPLTSSCPVFDKKVIPDYNDEGFDSVESVEFEAGFGCVPIEDKPKLLPPQIQHQELSETEKRMRDYYYMTEEQRQQIDNEHLKKHGIY